MVTNSSAPRRGGSYNEQTLKGSCLMASALEVLFGFSAHYFALVTDLQEAYRSTRTGPITNSCRRFFWWTDIDDEESLAEFLLLVSTYGDRPAGNILAQALYIIATDDRVSQLVQNFILKNFFVDDGIVSSQSKAKERFFGVLWNFSSDQFLPALDVWLCKKTRGQHTDSQLSSEMISSCTFTSQNCWKFT